MHNGVVCCVSNRWRRLLLDVARETMSASVSGFDRREMLGRFPAIRYGRRIGYETLRTKPMFLVLRLIWHLLVCYCLNDAWIVEDICSVCRFAMNLANEEYFIRVEMGVTLCNENRMICCVKLCARTIVFERTERRALRPLCYCFSLSESDGSRFKCFAGKLPIIFSLLSAIK